MENTQQHLIPFLEDKGLVSLWKLFFLLHFVNEKRETLIWDFQSRDKPFSF
jgi:hypothetical protein